MTPRKTLIILRGMPGSAKSEIARILCPSTNVAADDYPGLYNEDGSYNLDLQKISHQWCFECVEKWMHQDKPMIAVHNTFMQIKYLENYIDLAKEHGYSAQILCAEGVILPDGSRTTSIHNVPRDILERMAKSYEPLPTGYEEYIPDY